MNAKPRSGLAVIVLGASLALAPAARGEPLAIRTRGALPFTGAQLEAVLASRAAIAPAHGGARVVATIDGDGASARVDVVGRARVVQLGDARGADAARLVAFAILDLAGDQLDPPSAVVASLAPASLAPPSIELAPIEPAPLELASVARAIEPAAPRHDPRWSLGAWVASGSEARAEGALELGVPIAGAVRGVVSVGVGARETTTRAPATVALRGFPLRAGLAWRGPGGRLGQPELRAGAVARIEQASSVRAATEAVIGGGAAIGWAVPLAGAGAGAGVTITIGAGVDGFATARDYRVDGVTVVTSDRFAWWAGLGASGELWR